VLPFWEALALAVIGVDEMATSNKDVAILIIDDEEPIRRLLAAYLSDSYRCVAAGSAHEAMTLLSGSSFNLVLSDINMPGTSGTELCQYVNKAYPDTVVIMVSGMTDITFAIEAMRQGAFDYITKPFDLGQVQVSIDRALRYQALGLRNVFTSSRSRKRSG